MTVTLNSLKVTLLIDNTVLTTNQQYVSPLYNQQFGVDWQGHRVEAKVVFIGDTEADPSCTGTTEFAVADMTGFTVC